MQYLNKNLKIIFEFSLSHGFTLGSSLLVGLILVRVMPIEEYAIYALLLSMVSLISTGSDLGLNGAIGYFWRKYGNDQSAASLRFIEILRIRRSLFPILALIAIVFLYLSPFLGSFSARWTLFFIIVVCTTAWLQIDVSIGLTMIRLKGLQRQSYYCEAAGSAVRVAGVFALLLFGVVHATHGLMIALIGGIVSWLFLRQYIRLPKYGITVNREARCDAIKYILPISLTSISGMISEPLVLWLASLNTEPYQIAEAFATGRIGQLFGVVSSFLIIVVHPRLANMPDNHKFNKAVDLILIGLLCLCAGAITLSYNAPSIPLFLIGKTYSHLHSEVVVAILTASVTVLTTLFVFSNRLRGWVRLEPALAVFQMLTAIPILFFWQFSSSMDILTLNLIVSSLSAVGALIIHLLGRFSSKYVEY